MAAATIFTPLYFGGVLGDMWSDSIDVDVIKEEAFIFGALWMATAVIISHRSCQLQDSLDDPSNWIIKTIAISSFVLALMSGFFWHYILNEKWGYSIPIELGQALLGPAILGSKYSLSFFSIQK